MTTRIFVNLPVKDLDRSVDFFTRLGYRFDPKFTDRNATCMVSMPHCPETQYRRGLFKTCSKFVQNDHAPMRTFIGSRPRLFA